MKTRLFLVFLCFIPHASCLASDTAQEKLPQQPLTIVTSSAKLPFNVEMALTPEQQEQGLMQRKSVAENEGMLFLMPQEKIIQMWMKDTIIPLDMLFIDHTGTIVHIAHSAPPLSLNTISTPTPVSAVLELSGGTSQHDGIHEGDHIIHSYFKP